MRRMVVGIDYSLRSMNRHTECTHFFFSFFWKICLLYIYRQDTTTTRHQWKMVGNVYIISSHTTQHNTTRGNNTKTITVNTNFSTPRNVKPNHKHKGKKFKNMQGKHRQKNNTCCCSIRFIKRYV